MKILHMLALGGAGGIESLCVDIARYSKDENYFYFFWGGGENAERIKLYTPNVVIRNFKNRNILKEYISFSDYVLKNNIECIIVQGMSPAMSIFLGIFLKYHNNVMGCQYLHANSEDLFSKKIMKALFKWFYRYADGCIAISESVKESMKNICNTEYIQVIYNGTDCKKYNLSKNEKKHSTVRLLYVGRIVKKKGLSLLIDALSQLDLPFELDIVGGGTEEEELKKKVMALGLGERIKFAGVQWNIEQWLSEADIFVHPATWQEGFGITLIEAMAAGVPCVAFERGAIPEIITDNVNGYLAREVSVQSYLQRLRFAILQWNTEPEKFLEVSRKAKERAQYFDIHRFVDELSAYLCTLKKENE